MSTKTSEYTAGTNTLLLGYADIVFPGLTNTFRYLAVAGSTAVSTTSPLPLLMDFATDQIATAQDVRIGTAATGLYAFSASQAMSYSSVVLADAPLAYWRLGDASETTMTDSSGSALNGTYTGLPTLGATGLLAGDSDTAVSMTTTPQYGAVTTGEPGCARRNFTPSHQSHSASSLPQLPSGGWSSREGRPGRLRLLDGGYGPQPAPDPALSLASTHER